MTVDQIEELIRKYLATGIAVVIVLIGPATATSGAKSAPEVLTVTPGPSTGARATTAVPGATDVPPTITRSPVSSTDETETTPTKNQKKDRHHHDTGTTSNVATPTATPAAAPDTVTPDAVTPDAVTPEITAPEVTSPEITAPVTAAPEITDTAAPATTAPATSTAAPTGPYRTQPPGGTGPTDTRAPSARTPAGEGTTAAATFGWGTPTRQDDFTGDLSAWGLYDGPGHAGQGRRAPSAATVSNGVLTIGGDAAGTTEGMAWGSGQKYGRWEGRVKAPASDPSYNALLLLWPDAEDFPAGGEIDFMEMADPSRLSTDLYVHHGADDAQVHGQVRVDATQWHNWAVEWTPKGITAFVDGKRWWHSDDTSILPPGPMHLCVQLDWFPKAGGAVRPSQMQLDWVRQYALDDAGSTAATATATPSAGDTATGDARGSVMRAVIRRMFGW